MNTFDYSLLIKDLKLHNKVSKLQKIKTILFWLIFPICLLSRLGDFFDLDETVSLVILGIAFLFIIGELLFNLIFFVYVDKCRKSQSLTENDQALISLNQKYDVHFKRIRKLFTVCTLVAAIGFILFVAFAVLGSATDKTLYIVLFLISFLMFLAAILVCVIVSSIKSSKFTKIVACEIEELNNYFNELKGLSPSEIAKKSSNTFTNYYAAQKSLTYLYPDENIRKKILKLSYLLIIPIMIVAGIAGGIGAYAALNDNLNLLYICLISGLIFTIAAIFIFSFINKNVIKSQRIVFESNKERYKYYLELADLTKKNQRKMSICTIAALLMVIFIGVIIGVCIDNVTAINVGILIFACLILWLFFMLPLLFINTKSYRVKAAMIEQKIDEHNNMTQSIFEFDNLEH